MNDIIHTLLTIAVVIISVYIRSRRQPANDKASAMVSTSVEELTKKLVSPNAPAPVFIASKTWCGYCSATKTLLLKTLGLEEGTDVNIVELDKRADGDEIQHQLQLLSGQRSVPNIYINGKHIGGNSDLQALHRAGKLVPLLKQKTAI